MHIIAGIVYNIETVINCLKRTEIYWFGKWTFYITIRAFLRCLT